MNMWLQHNGAPAHFGKVVEDYLIENGLVPEVQCSSPPRSPDLTAPPWSFTYGVG